MRKLGTVEPGAAIEGVYIASAAYIAASGGKLTAQNNTVKETVFLDLRDSPPTVLSYLYQNDSGDVIVAPPDRDADLTAASDSVALVVLIYGKMTPGTFTLTTPVQLTMP